MWWIIGIAVLVVLYIIGSNMDNDNKKEEGEATTKGNATEGDIIELGESTRILKYGIDIENKFKNHIKFKKAAVKAKQYPKVKILSMVSNSPSASCKFLIIETGSKVEYLRKMDDQVIDKIFEEVHPGKDFEEIWADGTVMNTAPANGLLESTLPFDQIASELSKGYYTIIEVLSDDEQSNELGALENESHNKLAELAPNGFDCRCDKIHLPDEIVDYEIEENTIFFRCPQNPDAGSIMWDIESQMKIGY